MVRVEIRGGVFLFAKYASEKAADLKKVNNSN